MLLSEGACGNNKYIEAVQVIAYSENYFNRIVKEMIPGIMLKVVELTQLYGGVTLLEDYPWYYYRGETSADSLFINATLTNFKFNTLSYNTNESGILLLESNQNFKYVIQGF
mmetsp:Transcript_18932/g.18078  ORF Transcript_18932/g.18078 Transcript_18932/m.18078 type:complete len:112 (-) Transcript_18932:7-342(-)